jgi:hypothetical protein
VAHGGRGELLREIDLDAQGIAARVREMAGALTPMGGADPATVLEEAS